MFGRDKFKVGQFIKAHTSAPIAGASLAPYRVGDIVKVDALDGDGCTRVRNSAGRRFYVNDGNFELAPVQSFDQHVYISGYDVLAGPGEIIVRQGPGRSPPPPASSFREFDRRVSAYAAAPAIRKDSMVTATQTRTAWYGNIVAGTLYKVTELAGSRIRVQNRTGTDLGLWSMELFKLAMGTTWAAPAPALATPPKAHPRLHVGQYVVCTEGGGSSRNGVVEGEIYRITEVDGSSEDALVRVCTATQTLSAGFFAHRFKVAPVQAFPRIEPAPVPAPKQTAKVAAIRKDRDTVLVEMALPLKLATDLFKFCGRQYPANTAAVIGEDGACGPGTLHEDVFGALYDTLQSPTRSS